VQRDIGWGTVIDLTYVGNVTRHLELAQNINVVRDGARFLPQNLIPGTTTAKSDTFLRPYPGYENINLRSHHGTSNYNGLQAQINRRYIRGLQFAIAYSYGRSLGVADEDEAFISAVRPLKGWHYAPHRETQTHNLVINYTWDTPKLSRLFGDNGVVKFLFDDWQLSGENAFVSGDWTSVNMTTVDNFDFTGGTGGNGGDIGGGVRVVRPRIAGDPIPSGDRDATPGGPGSWVNAAAFARPSGRGDIGDAPRYVFRSPGIQNWNLAMFKNFPLGSSRRRIQLRVEGYNVLNQTQFSTIDNTVRFDAAGNQVNANFGKATAARNPRIVVGSIRFTF